MNLAMMAICVLMSQTLAQQRLGFKEFYDIMENSKFTYTISECKETICDTTVPPTGIQIDTKAIERNGGIEIVTYKRNPGSKKLLEEIETYYKSGNNERVRTLCNKMLNSDSTDSKILTYMGETYQKENNYDEALYWYDKALVSNYNNWLTHSLLGRCYFNLSRTDSSYREKSIREYATAMILNRSVKSLEETYQQRCKEFDKSYSIWKFIPQCKIWKNKKTIYIETDKTWLGYAIARAVRQFEPGYSIKNIDDEKTAKIDTNEEKEYLLNFITANAEIDSSDSLQRYFKPKENVTDPAAITLIKAANKKMLTEYILYEIWLPKNPILIYGLPRESLEKIVNYVLEVRTANHR